MSSFSGSQILLHIKIIGYFKKIPLPKLDRTPNELESLEWDADISGDSNVELNLRSGGPISS